LIKLQILFPPFLLLLHLEKSRSAKYM
jgi:hypothetical protein